MTIRERNDIPSLSFPGLTFFFVIPRFNRGIYRLLFEIPVPVFTGTSFRGNDNKKMGIAIGEWE